MAQGDDSNIYTVLMVIAVVALLVGGLYVWYRSTQVFGGMNPLSVSLGDLAPLTPWLG